MGMVMVVWVVWVGGREGGWVGGRFGEGMREVESSRRRCAPQGGDHCFVFSSCIQAKERV